MYLCSSDLNWTDWFLGRCLWMPKSRIMFVLCRVMKVVLILLLGMRKAHSLYQDLMILGFVLTLKQKSMNYAASGKL